MSRKAARKHAVPAGSFSTPDGKADKASPAGAERKRVISDEYAIERDSYGDLAESDFSDLNDMTVPPGQKPEYTLENTVQESDVHDLILPPSEIPDETVKEELFGGRQGEKRTEPKAVRRARAFSTIMSAVHGVLDQATPQPAEMEKAVPAAVEKTDGKTAGPEPPDGD